MGKVLVVGLLCLVAGGVFLLNGCGPRGEVAKKNVVDTEESNTGGDRVMKERTMPAPRQMKERTMPAPRQLNERTMPKSRTGLVDTEHRYDALVNRIRPGMTTGQVEAILGTPDESEEKDLGELNPQKAGQTLEIWKWTDPKDNKKFIMLSFVNGKLQEGGTPGYDIRKGFQPN